jgi:lipoprotein-anchoring transpeptidase ErfK/SrfK
MAERRTGRWMGNGLPMLFCFVVLTACSVDLPVADAGSAVAAPRAPVVAAPLSPPVAAASLAPPVAESSVVPAVAADAASASDFTVHTVLSLDRSIDAGDYAWNAAGVPAGPLRIVVDLDVHRIYVYRAGVEIGRASIIYGDDEKPTPTGIFPILQKRERHVSNLYGAPMPYMMRLTWDGIAIHGSDVDYDYATHGCVGVPEEFAALLFGEAKLGDQVLITNGWMPEALRY